MLICTTLINILKCGLSVTPEMRTRLWGQCFRTLIEVIQVGQLVDQRSRTSGFSLRGCFFEKLQKNLGILLVLNLAGIDTRFLEAGIEDWEPVGRAGLSQTLFWGNFGSDRQELCLFGDLKSRLFIEPKVWDCL